MKKGAALSVVLALGGTAMFWGTQPGGTGVWAKASNASDTADIIVPARTAILLFMSSPGELTSLMARFSRENMVGGRWVVKPLTRPVRRSIGRELRIAKGVGFSPGCGGSHCQRSAVAGGNSM